MAEGEDTGGELRSQADAALAEGDWHGAVGLYSKAAERARAGLKGPGGAAAASWSALRPLCLALGGRSRALVELGRPCGAVKANPDILQAAVADARAALTLARSYGGKADVVRAVAGLSDVLTAAGRPEEAKAAVDEALKADPQSEELRALVASTAQSALAAKMDEDADDGRSPGTFRWPRHTPLPKLPPAPKGGLPPAAVSDDGWEPYLRARGGEPLVASARTSAALLDGLSFPLSLAWALAPGRAARWPAKGSPGQPLHVVVLGATARAEVRLWTETAYWQELICAFAERCAIELEFLGPEVDPLPGDPGRVHQMAAPCVKQFFSTRPELTPANTVCTVFNGGFGNLVASGRDELLWSWLPDLAFLSEKGFLCTFFCANDYADLRGEVAVHAALLGSRFVLAPRRNPFSMATVYTGEPGGKESKEWFCGNSFVYATVGCEPSARPRGGLAAGGAAERRRLLAEVLLKAKAMGESSLEVCSGEAPLLQPSPRAEARRRKPAGGEPVAAGGSATAAATAELSSPVACAADAGPGGKPGSGAGPGVRGAKATEDRGGPGSEPAAAAGAGDAAGGAAGAAAAAAASGVAEGGGSRGRPETSVKCIESEGCRWLRYEVHLPGLESLEQVELQISDAHVSLTGAAGFEALREPWPEPVDAERAGAAFSSRKGRLVIRAPVRG